MMVILQAERLVLMMDIYKVAHLVIDKVELLGFEWVDAMVDLWAIRWAGMTEIK
jgi:hypothetical protein